MANTLATPTWTMKEVGRYWLNSIKFVANCDRTYDDQYIQSGAHVGNTVNARLPQRFQATDGQALQVQALYDQTVPISLTNQKNVGWSYSSAQATTELDEVRKRYVQPAAEVLANAADVLAFANVYADIYQSVGGPGAGPPSDTFSYLEANSYLTYMGAPEERVAVLDPLAMATIANASSTLFNPQQLISENYKNGVFGAGQLGIAKWAQDQNCPVHTTGTYTASTPLVNGANQTGAALATDGWASGASSLKKGDVFTIAGVYSVNRTSYTSTNQLQQFVVTADTSDSTGAMATLPISPSIITSGALQTVSGSPADNAVITVLGATSATSGTLATTTSKQSMLYVPDAVAFVMADLARPVGGAEAAVVRSKEFGISIRMVSQFQISTDQNPSRLDILIGAAAIRPEWAVRVWA